MEYWRPLLKTLKSETDEKFDKIKPKQEKSECKRTITKETEQKPKQIGLKLKNKTKQIEQKQIDKTKKEYT